MRTAPFRILLLVATVVLLSSCVTTADGKRDPLAAGEVGFVRGSIFYEVTMNVAYSKRAGGRMTMSDEQWARAERVQRFAQENAPRFALLLRTWRATQERPANYDELAARFAALAFELAVLIGSHHEFPASQDEGPVPAVTPAELAAAEARWTKVYADPLMP